jgi:hypothetical protein
MNMRITKWDKQAIVKAVMADVPTPDDKQVKAEMQAALVKAMTPEVRKVYKLAPTALRTGYIRAWEFDIDYGTDLIVGDADMDKVLAPWKAKKKEREAARSQLVGAIEACTTLKQLNTRLPEFKKYFPTEQKPVANLPALANVVADLSKLGWPKGETK